MERPVLVRQLLTLRNHLSSSCARASNLSSRLQTCTRASIQSPLQRNGARRSFQTSASSSAKAAATVKATQRPSATVFVLGVGLAVTAAFAFQRTAHAESATAINHNNNTSSFGSEPSIRLAEVKTHGKDAERVWITRGDRVYDITEWIPNHPGGEIILRGSGGSVEPYWKIFAIHNKPEVIEILEQYFIGVVDPRDLVDGKIPQGDIVNPFEHDPHRDGRLDFHTSQPCNAETPKCGLQEYITPNELFYVRNHMWVPDEEATKDHRLTIELPNGDEVSYSMQDLRQKFKEHTITATLQCAGNRRSHMNTFKPTVGTPWGVGAIGNATWSGVLLRDVLQDAGFDVNNPPDDIKHTWFTGVEAYGASIPLDKAIDRRGDVLLAYSMNGKTLPRDHGYPLRAIVPGHVGARNVKWVNRIALSDEESPSQWQRRDYKGFGPNVGGDTAQWEKAVSIQEMPVQSALTRIRDLDPNEASKCLSCKSKVDAVAVEGYAMSGGGRRIVRVDVSADGGQTWKQATLLNPDGEKHEDANEVPAARGSKSWAWQRWIYYAPRSVVNGPFVIKAIDEGYNTQPDTFDSQFNFKGNLSTAWHRVPYTVCPAPRKEHDGFSLSSEATSSNLPHIPGPSVHALAKQQEPQQQASQTPQNQQPQTQQPQTQQQPRKQQQSQPQQVPAAA